MIKLQRLLYWAFFLFIIYLAFELIRKLLGGSLGFEELAVGLLVANIGYSYHISSKLSEHLGWHKGKDSYH